MNRQVKGVYINLLTRGIVPILILPGSSSIYERVKDVVTIRWSHTFDDWIEFILKHHKAKQ